MKKLIIIILLLIGSAWCRVGYVNTTTNGTNILTNMLIDAGYLTNVGGGGSSTAQEYGFGPLDFWYLSSNTAVLDNDAGTNALGNTSARIKRYLFDSNDVEGLEQTFTLPASVGTGNVSFTIYGYPTTAAATDAVIGFTTLAIGSNESWDTNSYYTFAVTNTCSTVQDNISAWVVNQDISTLGWSAGDQILFKIYRDADNASDTLLGDFGLTYLRISTP